MDFFFDAIAHYFNKLAAESGEVAQQLDGTGWAIVSAVLLVCGWFFLRGKKISTV